MEIVKIQHIESNNNHHITIPAPFIIELGLKKGDNMRVELKGDKLVLSKVTP